MAETEPSFDKSESEFTRWLGDFHLALGFLTRLPLKIDWGTGDLGRAFRAFPLAGALIGALGGAAFWICTQFGLPAIISAFVAVAVLILLFV